ncbi:SUMO-specific isopeptidase USPL1 isoform X2 [Cololabis saira]|uniref:SUMO-specific isopeptidase USPL1 isoform X2 n=1 Tax=Cololabis saira TaxID=129043 RepID=UPI002AD43ADE|nr:SUMO-specific isopeptidase USPL1 isoform X2 [Cololabis saira]
MYFFSYMCLSASNLCVVTHLVSLKRSMIKVQERAASLENCPWCSSKGFTYALRSYHINLQESITLCTNPQCLFPLVTRPLEDVLSSLEPSDWNKRKQCCSLEKEELLQPPPKRLRTGEAGEPGPQGVANSPVRNGLHATPETDAGTVNGYHQDEDVIQGRDPDAAAYIDALPPSKCSASVGHLSEVLVTAGENEPALSPGSSQGISPTNINVSTTQLGEQTAWVEEKSQTTDVSTCKDADGITSECEDLSRTSSGDADELVSAPEQLFWRNSNNLCWLDSLLAALVNCKSLRKCKPADEPQQSAVWQLMRGYEDVSASIQVQQQTGRDGVARVPGRVVQTADADLQALRMSVFTRLQPKLHCKLGQRETPVFAMPLLLETDSWAERLFQSTFHWEFKCSECKANSVERVTKTLPTFTKIVPDWHPLHAVHFSPCNVCGRKNQKRTMLLQSVPAVFALHFVEGLPDNDVGIYSFSFQGKHHSVSTVIQYNQQLKHFVTWIRNSDGSWLELDDLKHPGCRTCPQLQIPAHEMHVVFWEVEDGAESSACSPSSTFVESAPPTQEELSSLTADGRPDPSPDQSLLIPHNDTDIVCALSEDAPDPMSTTVTASADTSIGATSLLDTFEGLSHSDIITLTLVEVNAQSPNKRLSDNQRTVESGDPRKEKLVFTADSSSVAAGPATHGGADVDTEAQDEASDPTFVPRVRRGRGRAAGGGNAPSRRKVTKAQATSDISPAPASTRAASPAPFCPAAQDDVPGSGSLQQTSPVSSTGPSSQKSPTGQSPPDQASRWSSMLSKHPLNQVQKTFVELSHAPFTTPAAQKPLKSSRPAHSTPVPVNRQPLPTTLPRLRLLTDESEGLPLKAAEMYGGFNTKSSPPPRSLPPNAKPSQPVPSQHPANRAPVPPVTSPPESTFLGAASLQPHKKPSSQSLKIPPGLGDRELLRYKLMRKLKAKKKKLAKLQQLLGGEGAVVSRPDSTDLNSPSAVSSSTYDGSTCDDFLLDLLSPATSASNRSPDSTGFFETAANGKAASNPPDCAVAGAGAVSQNPCGPNGPHTENFLEDFLSQCCGFD